MSSEHVPTKQEVSTSEASHLSGLSQGYLTSALRQGKLEGRRSGTHWVVSRDSLDSFLGPDAPFDRQFRYAGHLTSLASQAFRQGESTEALRSTSKPSPVMTSGVTSASIQARLHATTSPRSTWNSGATQ